MRGHRLGCSLQLLFFAVLGALLAVPAAAVKDKPPITYTIPLPNPPDFSQLDWLVGEWAGKTISGGAAAGEVHFSASYDLEKRIMILRGDVSLLATRSAAATQESWMGILGPSADGAGYTLRTFSSRGFIAQYRVIVEGPEVTFNPEGGEKPPPGWLFRRLIQRTGVGEFSENVQVAPPGKSFFDYYSAKLNRVQEQGKSAPEKPNPEKASSEKSGSEKSAPEKSDKDK